jgi:hypothetical protein
MGDDGVRGASTVEDDAYHAYISHASDDEQKHAHSTGLTTIYVLNPTFLLKYLLNPLILLSFYPTVAHAISHCDSSEIERLHASHAAGAWLASLLVRTLIHTYIYTYIHTYIHIYIHTYTNTYIHTHIHTLIHTYIHTLIHTYIHTLIHTYIHTLIHTYIHIH